MKVGKFFKKFGCLIPPVHKNSNKGKKRRRHERSESKASSTSHQTGLLFTEDSCARSTESFTHRGAPAAADPARPNAPGTGIAPCSSPDDGRARSPLPCAPKASEKLVVAVDKTAAEIEAAVTLPADGKVQEEVATCLVVAKSALVAPCVDALVVPAILNLEIHEDETADISGTGESRCRCASEATTDSGRESTDAIYYSAESSFVGKTAAQNGRRLGDSAHWEYSGSIGEGSIFGTESSVESLLVQKKDLTGGSPGALLMGAWPAPTTTLLGANNCMEADSTKTALSGQQPPSPDLVEPVPQDPMLIDIEKAVDELAIGDFGSQNTRRTLDFAPSSTAPQAFPAEPGELLAAGYNATNAKVNNALRGSPEPAKTVGHQLVEANNAFSETIYLSTPPVQATHAHKCEHVVDGSHGRVIREETRTDEHGSSAALVVEDVTILDVKFNLNINNEAAAQQGPLDHGSITEVAQLTSAVGYASQKLQRSLAYDQLLWDLLARLEGREENEVDSWQLLDGVEDRMLSLRRWVSDYKREVSSKEGLETFTLSVKALYGLKSEGRRIHVYTALRYHPALLIRFHVLLPPNEHFPSVPLTLLDFDSWDKALKVGLPENEVDRRELKELASQAYIACPVPEKLMDRAVALLDPCRHMFLILLFSIFLRAEDVGRYWTREVCPSNGKLLWLLQKSPDNFDNFLRDRFVQDLPFS